MSNIAASTWRPREVAPFFHFGHGIGDLARAYIILAEMLAGSRWLPARQKLTVATCARKSNQDGVWPNETRACVSLASGQARH